MEYFVKFERMMNMRHRMQKISVCVLLGICLCGLASPSRAALYIPDVSVRQGIGGARNQALEMDLRALEMAAVQFSNEEAETAANLDGGNHIEYLAKYTDVPSKFSPGAYSFYVSGGEWWIGVAVARDAGRENIAGSAASNGLYGSPDVDTLPSGEFFQSTDAAAWKRIR